MKKKGHLTLSLEVSLCMGCFPVAMTKQHSQRNLKERASVGLWFQKEVSIVVW